MVSSFLPHGHYLFTPPPPPFFIFFIFLGFGIVFCFAFGIAVTFRLGMVTRFGVFRGPSFAIESILEH